MNDTASSPPATITLLIERANAGDGAALNGLFAALYPELHGMARARLRRNTPLTLLDTTSLLHEVYLRLVKLGELKVENRGHFLAYASRTMRSIIVDFARQKLANRRGGAIHDVGLDDAILHLPHPAAKATSSVFTTHCSSWHRPTSGWSAWWKCVTSAASPRTRSPTRWV